MRTRRTTALFSIVSLGFFVMNSPAAAGETQPSSKEVKQVVTKAYNYFKSAQNENGSFAPKLAGPGVSALVAAALLKNGYTPDDPVVSKTLNYLKNQVQKDGGVYNKFLANYTTSIAVMAFNEANKNKKYNAILANAAKFLRKMQHREPESTTSDAKFGGAGYDAKSRPDLSNTIMFVEAMLDAGVPRNDPAIQKALKFISRCQNLAGEHNDQTFAKKATNDDRGGLTYTPFFDKKSRDATPQGGLRSLGSMTYGGLKSFLHAGVRKDDSRVKAAVNWIRNHYSLKENPGLGQRGLYYYYHTFGKAMDALGDDTFEDAAGKKHAWRVELFKTLKSKQQKNGSWSNSNRSFGESFPELATAFAILSVSYCRKE